MRKLKDSEKNRMRAMADNVNVQEEQMSFVIQIVMRRNLPLKTKIEQLGKLKIELEKEKYNIEYFDYKANLAIKKEEERIRKKEEENSLTINHNTLTNNHNEELADSSKRYKMFQEKMRRRLRDLNDKEDNIDKSIIEEDIIKNPDIN